MVDAIYIDNDEIQVIKNDEISFDTKRPSVALLTASKITTTVTVTFPSLIQARAYYRWQQGGGGQTKCELWSTLIWQEWGPGEVTSNELFYPVSGVHEVPGPTTRNLPSITIGSVPAAANYLDIRARLTRTVTPPALWGISPPVTFFPLGQWINLPGGSCQCEYFNPMIRHFDVVRSGNTIILNRYQSVKNSGNDIRVYAPGGNPQANITVNESGWNSNGQITSGVSGGLFSDGTPTSSLFPFSNDQIAILIDSKPYSSDGNKRPGGTNPCNGPYPDLTSTYSVELEITPGIYKPAT